jgi:hypothetical protein
MQRQKIRGTKKYDYAHLCCHVLVFHLSDAETEDHCNEGTMFMLTYDVKSSFLHLSDAAAEDQGNEEP